jgi:two-component system sensor histidine kinase PilS (NtrC family)
MNTPSRVETGMIDQPRAAARASPPPDEASQRQTWKPLSLLNAYRLLLAGLFCAVAVIGIDLPPLGERSHHLFLAVSLAYFGFALFSALTIRWRKQFHFQLRLQILADIVAITALMYLSGGVSSGLGTLLIAALAGGGMLMSGRMACLYAAITALSVLGEEAYIMVKHVPPGPNFTHAGLLGATFFATAILAYLLARRARESEALAAQRGIDLANMQQLTEYVIQRMQTGVIVVDPQQRVRLINESAWRLLGDAGHPASQRLADLSPTLAAYLVLWQENPDREIHAFHTDPASPELLPRFARLGNAGTLIFIEDTAATAQQAQQMKLASLGRFTASIAHEIRNPLAAISHAGQLLAESPRLAEGDSRLTDIIQQHSQRMNAIVENILQLSRRQRAHPEEFELKPWLQDFVATFCTTEGVDPGYITLDIAPPDTHVRIDPSQLHQVMWNLCHNGLRYSVEQTGTPRLKLRGGVSGESANPFLEVIDFGPGVSHEALDHLFEPFFTTEPKGTGLGLYISRELCESNQARLNYMAASGGGGCFRIVFADPRRKQLA